MLKAYWKAKIGWVIEMHKTTEKMCAPGFLTRGPGLVIVYGSLKVLLSEERKGLGC